MVRGHEQAGRIGKRLVVREQAGLDVTVWADQRKASRRAVETPSDAALAGIGREESVRMHIEHGIGQRHPPIVVEEPR